MRKWTLIALAFSLASSQAWASVVFLADGTQHGNGRGALVCVDQGVGRVSGCGSFQPSGNPGHQRSNGQTTGWFVTDGGGWLFHNDPRDPMFGTIQINCAHPDAKGVAWLNY